MIVKRIADKVKLSFNLLVFDFNIRKGSKTTGAPIDKAFASVNEAFLVELNENLTYRDRQVLIHGEENAAPITGSA